MTTKIDNKVGKFNHTTSVESGAISPEILEMEKTLCVKIKGWSMYPLIHHGDILLIQPIVADTLRTGDIVFFRLTTGNFVVHRLIRKTGTNTMLMNGDSRRVFDEPIVNEQVFGKITKIKRDGKVLNLEGRLNNIVSWFITLLARNRVPLQITLKQNLARIQWLFLGKRTV